MEIANQDVRFVRWCELSVEPARWRFAEVNAHEIAAHWHKRQAENSRIFNGTVHILVEHDIRNDTFFGRYVRTSFAAYLYWRETGFAPGSGWDGFSTALLRNSDNAILVARAAPHTLNAGLYVTPGGMIDERDVSSDARINIINYSLRELAEETGLNADIIDVKDGAWIARDNAFIAMAIQCRTRLSNADVMARFTAHARSDSDAELVNPKWWPLTADNPSFPVPRYLDLLRTALAENKLM